MKKQEAIELVKNTSYSVPIDNSMRYIREETAIKIINCIDEPEKPVLSKEEAEWVDKLKEFFITRCSYGDYSFAFSMCGKTYKLPIKEGINHEELNSIRERLVNAVLYGYEVENEKLYTAQLKSTGEYLHYDAETDKIHHLCAYGNTAKNSKNYHFTKDTLLKYNAWENEAYDINEVKK